MSENKIIIDLTIYRAPRVGTESARNRAIRRAQCGHNVYVSKRGLHAIAHEGKRLYCDPCLNALVTEQGLTDGGAFTIEDGPA